MNQFIQSYPMRILLAIRAFAMAVRPLGVGVAITTRTGILLIVAVAFVASHPL